MVLYRHSRIRHILGYEEVKPQKPQTVEPPTPHTEEHITDSSFPIHSENYFVFYLDSQVSSKRRFYTSTIIPRGDISTVRQSQPMYPRVHVRIMFAVKGIVQINPLFRSQTTNSSINMAVENVFDTPDGRLLSSGCQSKN